MTTAPSPTRPVPEGRASERPAPRVPRALDTAAALSWRFLLVAAAVAVLALALDELRLIVLPVVGALFLTALLLPPTGWLRARRWPPLLATWTVVIAAAAILTGVVYLLASQVADEFGQLGESIERGIGEVEAWLIEGPLELSREDIERYLERASDELRARSGIITSGVLSGAVLAAEVVVGILLTFVLLFFFLKDGDRISGFFLRQVAEPRRDVAAAMGRSAWRSLGSYIRGIAVVGVVDAVLIGIGLIVIGVPLVVPLMVLTFLGAFFPLVGAVLAGLIAALVALVSGGPFDALLVVGVVVVVQQVEGDVLAPLVLGRAVRLHPLVILLSLTAGAVIAGVAGAFLAVPMAAVAVAAAGEYRNHRDSSPVPPPA